MESVNKCEICDFERAVDRCHIYPARIIKGLVHGLNKYDKFDKLGYRGDHIIILCKNCHWLYDHHKLNRNEFDKIKSKVVKGLIECREVMKQHAEKGLFDEKLVNDFTGWATKMNVVITKNYGNS